MKRYAVAVWILAVTLAAVVSVAVCRRGSR